jgi:hypothetical protein
MDVPSKSWTVNLNVARTKVMRRDERILWVIFDVKLEQLMAA